MYKNSNAKEKSLGMDMKITESGNSSPRVSNCKGPEEPNLTEFPSEVLQRIFSFLPYSDLFSSSLVCRMFRDNASVPVLWKKFPIPADEITQDDGLARLLSVLKLPRFRTMQHLDLNRVFMAMAKKKKGGKKRPVFADHSPDDQSKFLEVLEIASKLPLTWLNLSYNDLPSVFVSSPQFLSRLILNIPHVELFATCRGQGASSDFIGNVLGNLTEASALHTVDLGGCDLDTLPIYLVTKLNYLTNVALEGAFMTKEQAKAFMVDMAKGSKIKKFDIGCELIVDKDTYSDVFENLDPELVATALNNLEHLIYNKLKDAKGDCCDFPPDLHLSRFLQEMGRNTKLKEVEMEENNFFHVAPEVVAKAFNNLEHLEMKPNPYNTSAQIVATLDLMAQKTRLKYVLFEYEDLSWLNPGLVARAVVQVEQVDMKCSLSRAHVNAILREIGAGSRLRRLNLSDNDVSKVPTHVREAAVKLLRREGGVVKLEQKGKKLYLKC
eukprot:GFUD01037381.1.p1 GENE.GFUD01037381.1~~GFUD01037381.1.p1  ORF type:complete len:494 (+),score=144.22 GFUD01037381.1:57-1538(+)